MGVAARVREGRPRASAKMEITGEGASAHRLGGAPNDAFGPGMLPGVTRDALKFPQCAGWLAGLQPIFGVLDSHDVLVLQLGYCTFRHYGTNLTTGFGRVNGDNAY